MRKVIMDNEMALKSLIKKEELTQEINELVKQNAEVEKRFNEIKSLLVREDEKVRPELVRESEQIEKSEYEVVSRVYLGKEGEDAGKAIIEISDRLEEFKIFFKKEKDAQNNNSDTAPQNGDTSDTGLPAEALPENKDGDNL